MDDYFKLHVQRTYHNLKQSNDNVNLKIYNTTITSQKQIINTYKMLKKKQNNNLYIYIYQMLLVPIDRLLSVTRLKLPTYTMHHYTMYYILLQLNITYSLNHQKLTLFIYTHMNQEHKGFSVF